MRIPSIVRLLAVVTLAASLAGCLTRRTVTVGGQTVEDGYVVKRPIKEAIEKKKN
jgi:hypothetical protein